MVTAAEKNLLKMQNNTKILFVIVEKTKTKLILETCNEP